MINLYWPVYKNLEKEVLELSYNINFDDYQFEYIKNDKGKRIKTPPYSVKIGDLLVRSCIEIEAVIRELTKGKEKNIRKTPNVDSSRPITTGCRLKYLNHILGLDKKNIIISCTSMYFKNSDIKSFYPFKHNKVESDDYYSAYNAIKHNRNSETVYKGNIRTLLRAIGALFLLNIYYKNECIFLGKNSSTNSISIGSDLFDLEVIRVSSTNTDDSVDIALKDFKTAVSAVLMIKTTKDYIVKEKIVRDKFTSAINEKITELSKTNKTQDSKQLMIRALQMVSKEELTKTYKNTEYEAVTVIPSKIKFYISQGCVSEHTNEQLIDLEKESELWKSNITII